jgi:hypothetical protein
VIKHTVKPVKREMVEKAVYPDVICNGKIYQPTTKGIVYLPEAVNNTTVKCVANQRSKEESEEIALIQKQMREKRRAVKSAANDPEKAKKLSEEIIHLEEQLKNAQSHDTE